MSTFRTAIALLLLVPGPALGQSADLGPLTTDRPDFTESTATVRPGRLQVEGGYTFSRVEQLDVHTLGELLVRVGLLDRLEARIGLNSVVWTRVDGRDEHGVQDLALGAKINLWAGSEARPAIPEVALLVSTTVPTGDEGFGADALQPGAKLALGWSISDRVAVGSNINVAYLQEGDDEFVQVSGSTALGVGLTRNLSGYVELFGFEPETDDGPDASFLNGGFTLLLSPDLQLDARAGVGLNGRSPEYFAGVGASWRR